MKNETIFKIQRKKKRVFITATAGLRASKDSKKRGAATTTGGDGEAGKGQGDGKIIGKEVRHLCFLKNK